MGFANPYPALAAPIPTLRHQFQCLSTRQCLQSMLELRDLHIQMDNTVRDAYGWQDLDLEHGFHEVETLPENDRTRHTISPKARREVLKRLLDENHRRAADQPTTPKPKRPKPKDGDSASESLIPEDHST